MNDKKSPHQDFVNDEPSDDDAIIELTDEVEPQAMNVSRTSQDESQTLKLDEEMMTAEPENGDRTSPDSPPIEADDEVDEDEIIASAIEESLGPDEDDAISLSEEIDQISDGTGPILTPDDEPDDDVSHEGAPRAQVDFLESTQEENLNFEHDEKLPPLDDDFEFETDDEDENMVVALDEPEDIGAQANDDIIEITEFDEYFPEDDEPGSEPEELLDLSDVDEDDFLELIEVEEDPAANDEKIINFGDPETESMNTDINRFFSEAIKEEVSFEDKSPGPLDDIAADGITGDMMPVDSELSMETARLLSAGRSEDIISEDHPISDTQGPPDAFLPGQLEPEPEVASLPTDQAMDGGNDAQESFPDKSAAVTLPANLSPEQIETAIERVIDEKFSGQIENIICDVIEKAVTREIRRLKESLFQNDSPESNPDGSIG